MAWSYGDIWETVAEVGGDRICQVQGDRRLTWTDFDRRANALAADLLDAGLGRHAKVAAYLTNGPEYLETYYAAFKTGLVPANVNFRMQRIGPAPCGYGEIGCGLTACSHFSAKLPDGGKGPAPAKRAAAKLRGTGSGCRGGFGAFLVQGEQAREDFVVGEVGRPAVGGGDRRIQLLVDVVEPRRALVVEVGEARDTRRRLEPPYIRSSVDPVPSGIRKRGGF
jgi:hypothetical protein